MAEDPYSLDRLQDVVSPDPVAWWPPAAVWWCVAALFVAWGVFAFAISVHNYLRNAYRRQAIRELEMIARRCERQGIAGAEMGALSELLKRVALVSYSRARVASLSGESWLRFLNESCEGVDFLSDPAARIGTASVAPSAEKCSVEASRNLLAMVNRWIVAHRPEHQL